VDASLPQEDAAPVASDIAEAEAAPSRGEETQVEGQEVQQEMEPGRLSERTIRRMRSGESFTSRKNTRSTKNTSRRSTRSTKKASEKQIE